MASPPSPPVGPRGNYRALVVLGIVGSFALAALVVGWAYLRFSGHNVTGLEGTWRDPNNPRHLYEFQPNGDLAAWVGSKSWLNRLGWSATWRRDGQQIIIRTDRNWDFQGHLDGGTIRGKMLLRDPSGAIENEIDTVWQKE
jgi:hypothetical protein